MNDFLQKQFTTGQFAAMYGINKRTLMYYDSIDLFKPAVVKENGYRYYTFGQTILFDAIQLLRKLRVPLEEIRTHLTACTPDTSLSLMQRQNQFLEREIGELMWLQSIVQKKINNMEKKRSGDLNKIEIIEEQAQSIIISESFSEIFEESAKVVMNFVNECYRTRSYNGYPLGFMLDAKKLQQGIYDQYTNCFYYVDKINNKPANLTYKPAGHYLVSYYKGHWLEVNQVFQKLVNYAADHNLTFKGHAYEESIMDDTTVGEDPNYIEVQISIPLQ